MTLPTGWNSIAGSGKRAWTGSKSTCAKFRSRRGKMSAGSQSSEARTAPAVADGELVITRVLDAPRDLVWKAWTEPERLMHWWGPKGFVMQTVKLDLRPGGVFHYG